MAPEIIFFLCVMSVVLALVLLVAWADVAQRRRQRQLAQQLARLNKQPRAGFRNSNKARDSRITRHDGTNSFCLAAAAAYPTRLPADDCRVIGMDMAQAADATMLSLVTHGAAVSTIHAADDCVRVTPVDIGSTFACEPSYSSSDYGSSSGCFD